MAKGWTPRSKTPPKKNHVMREGKQLSNRKENPPKRKTGPAPKPTKPKKKHEGPFKHMAGIVYIDASHRRKHLDPWVYYCNGTKERAEVLNKIIREQRFMLFMDDDVNPDLLFWREYFERIGSDQADI